MLARAVLGLTEAPRYHERTRVHKISSPHLLPSAYLMANALQNHDVFRPIPERKDARA
jgi:hypothetical protein